MEQTEMEQKAREMFKTAEGMLVDVLYGTSDGQLFLDPELAKETADSIADPVVSVYYRDTEVRKAAREYKALENMIFATDFVKRYRAASHVPVYLQYTNYAESVNQETIALEIFNFIVSRVFNSKRPISPGQKDKIYMFEFGIVNAVFLRRYAQGVVWQYGDNLVFTCPTHTQLMAGTYQMIFHPLLGEPE
jgi:hypothetical protein